MDSLVFEILSQMPSVAIIIAYYEIRHRQEVGKLWRAIRIIVRHIRKKPQIKGESIGKI